MQRYFCVCCLAAKRRYAVLARDRCGVKPLFYTQAEDSLIFGSELKTLLAHPLCRPASMPTAWPRCCCLAPGARRAAAYFKMCGSCCPASTLSMRPKPPA
ncbi:hypothetical protein NIA69_17585 [Gemmiger formicilis]|nr:hypothetical protein [Gemmiger formicilis]